MKITAMIMVAALLSATQTTAQTAKYKDAGQPVEVRVTDLLSRMTLQEKIGQIRCLLGWPYYQRQGQEVKPSPIFRTEVIDKGVGMLWATLRADPWTRKSLENGLTPALSVQACNALQRYNMTHSRLGIPLFFAEEAPHGHMAIGTTCFPTGIGVAATWSPDLAREMGQVIAREIRAQGAHISYGPVLDLSRDPRWSRVEESMGEDPVLTAVMGAAEVEGLGGGKLDNPHATIATLKHFIGYGTTEGGQNGGQSVITERDLRQNFLFPFRKAVQAGALSIMTSYNSIDGIPSTANPWLYRTLLKKDWNFRGFVVSDLYSVDGIWETHHVAATRGDAGAMAVNAGVDCDLGGKAYALLDEAVAKGKVSEAVIDSACANILRMKFEMGLFEHPYADPKGTRTVRSAAHRDVALRMAQASITLLKNKNRTLPLKPQTRVAVVGPNADNVYNMLGDYTAPQPEGAVVTLRHGLEQVLGAENVIYAKGCAIRDTTTADIAAAIEAARYADVIVAAVGGSSARDFKTTYKDTGAAEADATAVSDMDCGEGYDRSTLQLLGKQLELLKALKATGKPLVVVYIEGRPLNMNWAKEQADALICAYYPGEAGGQALADVICGRYNPAGRLPFSVPASEGQIPVYYNKRPPIPHNYVEETAQPAYAFGYGLSYTSFAYSNLKTNIDGDHIQVSFDITNTGEYDGEEVVQLYIHHCTSSVAQAIKQLAQFKRISIKKGETVNMQMRIGPEDLQIVNREMQTVVEPGEVELMVGSSSDKIELHTTCYYPANI